jgi:hypothetical protein
VTQLAADVCGISLARHPMDPKLRMTKVTRGRQLSHVQTEVKFLPSSADFKLFYFIDSVTFLGFFKSGRCSGHAKAEQLSQFREAS